MPFSLADLDQWNAASIAEVEIRAVKSDWQEICRMAVLGTSFTAVSVVAALIGSMPCSEPDYFVTAIIAPGCSQRMIVTSVASSMATQPAVGPPSVVCTKNAPPLPGMRSLFTPITTACL